MLFIGTSLYSSSIYFNYCIFTCACAISVCLLTLAIFPPLCGFQMKEHISYCDINQNIKNNNLQFYYSMSERGDLITNIQPSSSINLVYEAHRRLNKQVDDMTSKVDAVMDKSQAEFLLAYQNHIRKIKIQLSQIKSKTDAHEKQMSKNDRVNYLEKQVTLFREEALKLYDRLEQKTHEAEIYKIKSKELQKTCFIAQKEVKEHMRIRKQLETKLIEAENRIAEIQQELKVKNQTICRKQTHSQESNSKSVFLNNLNLRMRDQQTKELANKTISMGVRRKSLNYGVTGGTFQSRQDGQLKDWFLQCIKSIKKDVAQRKNTAEQLNFDYIKNIDEFKMVDKLRLLQKFMENEKLLIWMYQKIFPSRMEEVKDYLTNTTTSKKNNIQSEQAIISPLEVFEEIPTEKVELILPKMSQLKPRKNEVRNKISIKDGKLNLTTMS